MTEYSTSSDIHITVATPSDAESILRIYAPYVKETAITFEYEVPSVSEFEERIRQILARYPYLIAKKDNQILGYAYASAFKTRPAYSWSVETSIYVDCSYQKSGIGALLYKRLEELLVLQNICRLCACITYPGKGSIQFHEKQGYKKVAHFTASGFKFNTWHDMIWMEKHIASTTNPPAEFIPFPLLLQNFPEIIPHERKELCL